MNIQGREIGPEHPPYVVAEISANHNGRLENALALVRAARDNGADAVKLQTYRADTITMRSDAPEFTIQDGLWRGRTLYDLYEEASLPWEWHARLFEEARNVGITIFSSPFDHTAVDLLESLGAPAFKIASFELVDLPLIRRCAETGKPLIMSTGLANELEIGEAVNCASTAGASEIVLLHCVSGYPTPASEYSLRTIPDMRSRFGYNVGLSDHTLDNVTAIAAVALGAVLIEKHFTLDRSGGGADDSFSIEPADLKRLCVDARIAWECSGDIRYSLASSEVGNVKFRRSLYFVRDVREGEVVERDAVRSIRPGYGLPPKYLDDIVGRRAKQGIAAGTPVSWELLV